MPRTRTALVPKRCPGCEQTLGAESFAPSVWRRNSGNCRACRRAVESRLRPNKKPRTHNLTHVTCSKCKMALEQSAFMPSAWRRGSGYCRQCQVAYYADQKTPVGTGRLSEYTRARRRDRATAMQAIKAERGCLYCTEKHPAALDFHHRDRMGKTETVAGLCRAVRSMEAILVEVAKCDVVCSNCHRKLHYREGGVSYWPKAYQGSPLIVADAQQMLLERLNLYPVNLPVS